MYDIYDDPIRDILATEILGTVKSELHQQLCVPLGQPRVSRPPSLVYVRSTPLRDNGLYRVEFEFLRDNKRCTPAFEGQLEHYEEESARIVECMQNFGYEKELDETNETTGFRVIRFRWD